MNAVITGRRASQGAARAGLKPLEVDETGLVKLNPLFAWTYPFVEWYVQENGVPTNKLLSQGYRSVGDWHSTVKSEVGAGERGGRWAENKEKTECGLHTDYFTMKAAVEKVRGAQTDFCFERLTDEFERHFPAGGGAPSKGERTHLRSIMTGRPPTGNP